MRDNLTPESSVPIAVCNDNARSKSEVTTGEIVAASVWSVFFLIMIALAVADQALGRWIELRLANKRWKCTKFGLLFRD